MRGAGVAVAWLTVATVACATVIACATTMPLETYVVEEVPEYPTSEEFARSRDEVLDAVVAVLGARDVPIDLVERQLGRVTSGWKDAPSLIHRRRRVGDRPVPLPARYRLVVTVRELEEGVRVAVNASEETNFLILTGADPETGREYYRDSWRPTPTRSVREHEFLVSLREFLQRRSARPSVSDRSGPR